MNIDQLIRAADPAAEIDIPGPDSAIARQSYERMLTAQPARSWRRRLTIPLAGGAVAVATTAITLAVTVTPGLPVSPAAAAVLYEAAAAARHQKPVVLRPGEYLYTETRSFGIGMTEWKPGKVYYPEYVSTDQSWLTPKGAGKDIYTIVSPITFAHGTRSIWIKAGRPALFDHNPVVNNGDGVPLENLSHLPADPAALGRVIGQHKTGLADINADVEDPSSPGGTFYAAMVMLTDKSVGGTPALRSALFTVMAQQPGIKFLGHVRTRSGQNGVGLQTPPDRDGDVFKVIIAPATGQVLETDEYTKGALDTWTEFLGTGVVKQVGQVPGA